MFVQRSPILWNSSSNLEMHFSSCRCKKCLDYRSCFLHHVFVAYLFTNIAHIHQVKLAQLVGRLRRRAIVYTDSRVRSVNEVLTGVRVVKYNGWTAAFLKRINDLRAIEMHWIRRAAFFRASTSTLKVITSAQFAQHLWRCCRVYKMSGTGGIAHIVHVKLVFIFLDYIDEHQK